MDCPKCREDMVKEPYRQNDYLLCFCCRGLWVTQEDLKKLSFCIVPNVADTFTKYLCPSCGLGHELAVTTIESTRLEYCPACMGVFFDDAEIEKFNQQFKSTDKKSLTNDLIDLSSGLGKVLRFIASINRLIK